MSLREDQLHRNLGRSLRDKCRHHRNNFTYFTYFTMAIYLNRSDDRKILTALKIAQDTKVSLKIKEEAEAAFEVQVKLESAATVLAIETARFRNMHTSRRPLYLTEREKMNVEVDVRDNLTYIANMIQDDAYYAQQQLDWLMAAEDRRIDAAYYMSQRQSAVVAARSKHDALQVLADDTHSSSDDFDDEDYYKPTVSRECSTPERRSHCPRSGKKGHFAHAERKGHFVYTRGQ